MLRSLVQGLCGLGIRNSRLPASLAAGGSIRPGIIEPTSPPGPTLQHVRTTFILKRKKRVELVKTKKPLNSRKLKARHFLYELVEDTNIKNAEPVKVILKTSVEGVGSRGDMVEVRPHQARTQLLLPGLAVYASPENLEEYKNLLHDPSEEDQPSSPFANKTIKELSLRVISVSMNLHQPWTLEPWHVRVAFRKTGIIVPEDALSLPPHTISGPDLSLQGKEFIVRVKVNNKEEAAVRCKINHFSTDPSKRLPWSAFHWEYPGEPLFAEDAPLLEELARNNPCTRYPEEEAL